MAKSPSKVGAVRGYDRMRPSKPLLPIVLVGRLGPRHLAGASEAKRIDQLGAVVPVVALVVGADVIYSRRHFVVAFPCCSCS
jgi:hypothetical protein